MQSTYMTPSFFPTLLHLLWVLSMPGLARPFILGLGLARSLDLGPGLQRPLVQWDGLVQPGLNQPELSLACGELYQDIK